MECQWCRKLLSTTNPKARFCDRRCRQAGFRLRRRRTTIESSLTPGRFAYADPPYPGTSAKYYSDEPSFAGEVDHYKLVMSLGAGNYTGWALSTSVRSLRDILPICPPDARVCAWVKPIGVSSRTFGIHNTWEPLIVVGGRQLPPGKRDWLRAMPARGEGTLKGRKPQAFCAWLFEMLGMSPGDELDDLYPGSGIVGRCWKLLSTLEERNEPAGATFHVEQ